MTERGDGGHDRFGRSVVIFMPRDEKERRVSGPAVGLRFANPAYSASLESGWLNFDGSGTTDGKYGFVRRES